MPQLEVTPESLKLSFTHELDAEESAQMTLGNTGNTGIEGFLPPNWKGVVACQIRPANDVVAKKYVIDPADGTLVKEGQTTTVTIKRKACTACLLKATDRFELHCERTTHSEPLAWDEWLKPEITKIGVALKSDPVLAAKRKEALAKKKAADAKKKAGEATRKAEEEAKKVEEDAKRAVEDEARKKAEEEAMAEQHRKEKQEKEKEEARQKAEEDEKARLKAEEEAKRAAEEEETGKRDQEVAEEAARKQAEQDAIDASLSGRFMSLMKCCSSGKRVDCQDVADTAPVQMIP